MEPKDDQLKKNSTLGTRNDSTCSIILMGDSSTCPLWFLCCKRHYCLESVCLWWDMPWVCRKHCRRFGSAPCHALCAGDKHSPLVNAGLELLLHSMKDENGYVKYTAWSLSRMFETLHSPALGFSVITPVNLRHITGVLLKSIKVPNVAVKVCGEFTSLPQNMRMLVQVSLSSHLISLAQYLPCLLPQRELKPVIPGSYLLHMKTLNEVLRYSNIAESTNVISQLLPVIMTRLS